jgi:hypothetical protein
MYSLQSQQMVTMYKHRLICSGKPSSGNHPFQPISPSLRSDVSCIPRGHAVACPRGITRARQFLRACAREKIQNFEFFSAPWPKVRGNSRVCPALVSKFVFLLMPQGGASCTQAVLRWSWSAGACCAAVWVQVCSSFNRH